MGYAPTLEWLLEENDPSVRYETLKSLLGKPERDEQLQSAKEAIMKRGAVPAILDLMRSDEYTAKLPRFYTQKYKGLVWQLIMLGQLHADGENKEIKRYCEYILENSQEPQSGGFSMETSVKSGGGRKSGVIPCLTGNLVWSLIRLGRLEDARVQKAVGWLATYQRYDDGEGAPSGWPYDRFEICWGNHSCHMGVVKVLKALAEIPPEKRSLQVKSSIEQGVEYLLKHHIFKRSHDLKRVSRPGWRKFSFPLMYQTDVLEILLILTKLGVADERMDEALELVASKRSADGRWENENTLEGKFLFDLEQKGQSKWITLRALEVLKAAGRA